MNKRFKKFWIAFKSAFELSFRDKFVFVVDAKNKEAVEEFLGKLI